MNEGYWHVPKQFYHLDEMRLILGNIELIGLKGRVKQRFACQQLKKLKYRKNNSDNTQRSLAMHPRVHMSAFGETGASSRSSGAWSA